MYHSPYHNERTTHWSIHTVHTEISHLISSGSIGSWFETNRKHWLTLFKKSASNQTTMWILQKSVKDDTVVDIFSHWEFSLNLNIHSLVLCFFFPWQNPSQLITAIMSNSFQRFCCIMTPSSIKILHNLYCCRIIRKWATAAIIQWST